MNLYNTIIYYLAFVFNNPARVLGSIAFIIVAVVSAMFMVATIKKLIASKKAGKEISLNKEIATLILFGVTLAALFYAVLMSPVTSSILIVTILFTTLYGLFAE